MKRYQKFLLLWAVNSGVIYLSNLLLPDAVEVGNSIFKAYQAIVFSGFIWSMAIWYLEPIVKDLEIPLKEGTARMLFYLAANFASVWFIARFSFITGVGIASFWYAALIAALANLAQRVRLQYKTKKR